MMADAAQNPAPDAAEIERAIVLFRPSGGILLTSIHPVQKGLEGRIFVMPDELGEAVEWALTQNERGCGVYWTPNHVDLDAAPKARKDQVVAASWCWVDADPNMFKHKRDYEKARADIMEVAMRRGDSCTLVVDSGHGVQLFWRLDAPLSIDANVLWHYERLNEQLAQWVGAPPGCQNADRVMRLPGTINYPNASKITRGYPAEPTPARLLYVSDREYAPGAIEAICTGKVATPLRQRFEDYCSSHPSVAARYHGDPSGLLDISGSGRDMGMVGMLRAGGFTLDEARELLDDWTHGSMAGRAQGDRYWRRMWDRCYAGQESQDIPAPEFTQPGAHPLEQFLDLDLEELIEPEFVIDYALQAGVLVIAGASGVGKTTILVPLIAAAAGIHSDTFPIKPLIRRRVIYIAEDTSQVSRVLYSLTRFGGAACDKATLQDMFRVVRAQRMAPKDIAPVAESYRNLTYTNIDKETGVVFDAAPVIVFDTANATIDLDNENDNSEVGKAISVLKQAFTGIPIIIVAHTTKASKRSDAMELSARGAGAWEGDAQQTAYIFADPESDPAARFLYLGKTRFERRFDEIKFVPSVHTVKGRNQLSHAVDVTVRHCDAVLLEDGQRESERQSQRQAAQAAERFARRLKLVSIVREANQDGRRMNRSELAKTVSGRRADIMDDIADLVADGDLVEEFIPSSERQHPQKSHYLLARSTAEARDYRSATYGE